MLWALTAITLAGCASLLESGEAPVRTVRLSVPAAPERAAPPDAPSLNFEIMAAPGLDSDRLLTQGPDGDLGRFSGARWAEYSSEMIGDLLVHSIRASGGFIQVFHAPRHGTAQCRLALELQDFQARVDRQGVPVSAEIRIDGRYDCGVTAESLSLAARQAVEGRGLAEVVAAFQAALDALTRDLLGRVVPPGNP